MSTTQSTTFDSWLWYGEHIPSLAKKGLVVPNPSSRLHTQNVKIAEFFRMTMQAVQAFMLTTDARRIASISVETAVDIHSAVKAAILYLESRVSEPNAKMTEPPSSNVNYSTWIMYPVPMYGADIVNNNLRQYATAMMFALTEAMQHEDNKWNNTITRDFVDKTSRWLRQVYTQLAVDFFNVSPDVAGKKEFVITDELINQYNPPSIKVLSPWQLPTDPELMFTNDQLVAITRGIPATSLPANMRPWPSAIPFASTPVGDPLPSTTQAGTTDSDVSPGGSNSVTAGIGFGEAEESPKA